MPSCNLLRIFRRAGIKVLDARVERFEQRGVASPRISHEVLGGRRVIPIGIRGMLSDVVSLLDAVGARIYLLIRGLGMRGGAQQVTILVI